MKPIHLLLVTLLLTAMVITPLTTAECILITSQPSTNDTTVLLTKAAATPSVHPSSQAVIDDDLYKISAPDYTTRLIKSFGPVAIGKDGKPAKNGITSRFKSITDRNAWYRKVDSIYNATKHSIDEQFYYPRGPILGHARDAFGAITVELYDQMNVKEETINQIYTIINDEAKKQGIDDIPVIFTKAPMPQLLSNYNDIWRPVIGGIQGTNSVGRFTLGFAATRNGVDGVITAGHVGSVGTKIYQPNLNNQIGTVTSSSNGANSDAAFIEYSNTNGQIFTPSKTLSVTGTKNPEVDLQVSMSGASSGVTSGKIIKQTPLYNSFFSKTLENQWYVDLTSANGDSGAPIYYTDANGNVQIVGLLWGKGSYTTFSPISSVLSDI